MASPICFRLFTHCERRAASRAAWTAGSSRAIRTAMIAMTTRSSIRVNPRRRKLHLGLLNNETIDKGNNDQTNPGETHARTKHWNDLESVPCMARDPGETGVNGRRRE